MDIIIDLFDPKAYLTRKNIPFISEGKEVTSGWLGVKCPWCDDRGYHLGINLTSNYISCWRCGTKGSVIKLVQFYEKVSYQESLEIMEGYQSFNKPIDYQKYIPQREFHFPKEFNQIHYDAVPASVAQFLSGRGFHPFELTKEKELYYPTNNSKYCHRLIIPVYFKKKMVSFIARDVTGTASQPYKACPDELSVFTVKETLYGYDDILPGSPIIIVEGVIDQWKLGKGTVATFGTAWTREQIELIKSLHPSFVFILYDNEDTAQKSAIKLSQALWFAATEVFTLIDHKDPGELTLDEAKEVKKELLGP